MKKVDWKDIGTRALKTFVQAFIPIVIATLGTIDITNISASKSVIYSALLSGASAGCSAVWNFLQSILKPSEIAEETDEDEELDDYDYS